jgi:2-hydroxychromene-2-carboxylate isomerase
MTRPENVARVAEPLGVPFDALCEGIVSPAMKERVKSASQQALDLGVFGSPFFRVDGEPFWGFDRMEMLDTWLTEGGF